MLWTLAGLPGTLHGVARSQFQRATLLALVPLRICEAAMQPTAVALQLELPSALLLGCCFRAEGHQLLLHGPAPHQALSVRPLR